MVSEVIKQSSLCRMVYIQSLYIDKVKECYRCIICKRTVEVRETLCMPLSPKGKYGYSSTLSLASAREVDGVASHTPRPL
jgi:hypothetical protein